MLKLSKGKTYTVKAGGAIFHGAPLDALAVDRLVKKHTKIEKIKGVLREDFNATAFALDTFKATVTAWEKVAGDEGQALECNDANKELLYTSANDLAGEILEAMREMAREAREVEEKN